MDEGGKACWEPRQVLHCCFFLPKEEVEDTELGIHKVLIHTLLVHPWEVFGGTAAVAAVVGDVLERVGGEMDRIVDEIVVSSCTTHLHCSHFQILRHHQILRMRFHHCKKGRQISVHGFFVCNRDRRNVHGRKEAHQMCVHDKIGRVLDRRAVWEGFSVVDDVDGAVEEQIHNAAVGTVDNTVVAGVAGVAVAVGEQSWKN